jgi:hypothetical protein
MKKIVFFTLVALFVAGTMAHAATILGHGEEYQAMIGVGGGFDVPYNNHITLDGNLDPAEWTPSFYTFFGPSTLASWATKHGYIQNEPGAVVTDGVISQLGQSQGEDASEARTDADMFARLWAAWDENYVYQAFEVVDNVYDVTGTGDDRFWEKDGYFFEIDFLNTGSEVFSSGAMDFAAVPIDSAPYSLVYWYWLPDGTTSGNLVYNLDPNSVGGTSSGFSLTDEGWILETRASWAFLSRNIPGGFTPAVGWNFTNSYHVIDPDGDEGFGGQFQFGRGAPGFPNPTKWASWTLAGGGPTAVESTTWGNVKSLFR